MSTAPDAKQTASTHLEALTSLFAQADLDAVQRVYERLLQARDARATIYVAGNGGSAATATHFANDLGKATKRYGGVPIRAMCLNDNVSWLTALANDEGYERVFAGQLENFAGSNDVLAVISASGNSQNLIKAVELAQQRSVTTVGFLGFDGGALKNMVDDYVWFPTKIGAYEQAEDCHMTLCHILTMCLTENRQSGEEAL